MNNKSYIQNYIIPVILVLLIIVFLVENVHAIYFEKDSKPIVYGLVGDFSN